MNTVRSFLFVILIFLVAACDSSEEQQKFIEEKLEVSETRHPGISDSVVPLNSSQINVDGIDVTIVGIDFGKNLKMKRENGWKSSDDRGMTESFIDGFAEGFAKGISGGESEEAKNADGTLNLYLEMALADGERPKLAEFPIKVVDDKDTEYDISFQSYSHSPMSPNKKYLEIVSYKAYSDAEYFFIQIGDNHIFTVDAPEFKW